MVFERERESSVYLPGEVLVPWVASNCTYVQYHYKKNLKNNLFALKILGNHLKNILFAPG
jgi:hypothetical protein